LAVQFYDSSALIKTTLTLISSDSALNRAAAAEGVTVVDPNAHP
jgi:hypothetical protein